MSWMQNMDWAWVIDRNRTWLLGIVATLFAMAGLDMEEGGRSGHNSGTVTLPRWVYRSIMLVLRPAESALRRLVIIAARGLKVEVRAPDYLPLAGRSLSRDLPQATSAKRVGSSPLAADATTASSLCETTPSGPAGHLPRKGGESAAASRCTPMMVLWHGRIMPYKKAEALLAAGITSPSAIPPRLPARSMEFRLFDPLPRSMSPRRNKRRFVPVYLCEPISRPGVTGLYRLPPPKPTKAETRPSPTRDDALNAHRLILRLRALKGALDDIPAQAKRLALLRARHETNPNTTRKRFRPLRPGRPPGRRKRRIHEIDRILNACDYLAKAILKEKPPDTS